MEIISESHSEPFDNKLGHVGMQKNFHRSSLLFLRIKLKNSEETEDKVIRVSPSRCGRMCVRMISRGNMLESFKIDGRRMTKIMSSSSVFKRIYSDDIRIWINIK
ncbi:F-box protein [Trifolium repens]|nr:F-box protein [Trifolium repens]